MSYIGLPSSARDATGLAGIEEEDIWIFKMVFN